MNWNTELRNPFGTVCASIWKIIIPDYSLAKIIEGRKWKIESGDNGKWKVENGLSVQPLFRGFYNAC